jgi:hypothetical protein
MFPGAVVPVEEMLGPANLHGLQLHRRRLHAADGWVDAPHASDPGQRLLRHLLVLRPVARPVVASGTLGELVPCLRQCIVIGKALSLPRFLPRSTNSLDVAPSELLKQVFEN